MRRRIAFRFDAGVEIGYGHLTRCLALATELQALGHECHAVTRSPQSLALPQLTIGDDVAPADEGRFIAERLRPDLIVADLYRSSAAQLEGYRRACPLVRIEDEAAPAVPCALLVNPNLADLPAELVACAESYFGGGAAIPLRRQFTGLPAYEVRRHVRTLAVCFGGSDPVDATARVVALLGTELPATVERVDVVVGPGYHDAGALRASVAGSRFVVLENVADMAALLRGADVGILAAGTLLYEALAVGLPAIFIALTQSQEREARAADAAGGALCLGSHERVDRGPLAAALATLADAAARRAMSTAARRLIDGDGSRRTAARIAALLEAR